MKKKKIPIILVTTFFGLGAAFPALAVDYSDAAVIARVQEALNFAMAALVLSPGFPSGVPQSYPSSFNASCTLAMTAASE